MDSMYIAMFNVLVYYRIMYNSARFKVTSSLFNQQPLLQVHIVVQVALSKSDFEEVDVNEGI